jgi:hypothetical protein
VSPPRRPRRRQVLAQALQDGPRLLGRSGERLTHDDHVRGLGLGEVLHDPDPVGDPATHPGDVVAQQVGRAAFAATRVSRSPGSNDSMAAATTADEWSAEITSALVAALCRANSDVNTRAARGPRLATTAPDRRETRS